MLDKFMQSVRLLLTVSDTGKCHVLSEFKSSGLQSTNLLFLTCSNRITGPIWVLRRHLLHGNAFTTISRASKGQTVGIWQVGFEREISTLDLCHVGWFPNLRFHSLSFSSLPQNASRSKMFVFPSLSWHHHDYRPDNIVQLFPVGCELCGHGFLSIRDKWESNGIISR